MSKVKSEVRSRVYESLSDANKHAKKLHETGRQPKLCRCVGGHLLTWRENVFVFKFSDREIKYDGSKRLRLTPA